jgi:hypothetical protein
MYHIPTFISSFNHQRSTLNNHRPQNTEEGAEEAAEESAQAPNVWFILYMALSRVTISDLNVLLDSAHQIQYWLKSLKNAIERFVYFSGFT